MRAEIAIPLRSQTMHLGQVPPHQFGRALELLDGDLLMSVAEPLCLAAGGLHRHGVVADYQVRCPTSGLPDFSPAGPLEAVEDGG